MRPSVVSAIGMDLVSQLVTLPSSSAWGRWTHTAPTMVQGEQLCRCRKWEVGTQDASVQEWDKVTHLPSTLCLVHRGSLGSLSVAGRNEKGKEGHVRPAYEGQMIVRTIGKT